MDKLLSIYHEIDTELIKLIEEKSFKDKSQAFAFLFLKLKFGLSDDEASESVTDDFDDNDIDSVYYSKNEGSLYLLQFKFPDRNINKAIDQSDISTFVESAKKFVGSDNDFSKRKWNNKLVKWRDVIKGLQFASIRLLFVSFTTQQLLNSDMYQKALTDYSGQDGRSFSIDFVFANAIIDYYIASNIKSWPTFSLKYCSYHCDERVNKNNKTAIAYISLLDYYHSLISFEDDLYEGNVRYFYDDSDVNNKIIQTLRNSPEEFYLLNNGITVLCSSFYPNKPNQRIDVTNGSIVNGAQTTQCILKIIGKKIKNQEPTEQYKDAFVLVRIIETVNNLKLTNRVIYSLNAQNKMPVSYFISNNTNVRFLQHQFERNGLYFLEIKRNEYKKEKLKSNISKEKVDIEKLIQAYELVFNINKTPHLVSNRKALFFKEEIILPILDKISYEDSIHALNHAKYVEDLIRRFKRYSKNKEQQFIDGKPKMNVDTINKYSFLPYGKNIILYGIGVYERVTGRNAQQNIINKVVRGAAEFFNSFDITDYRNYLRTKNAFESFAKFIIEFAKENN